MISEPSTDESLTSNKTNSSLHVVPAIVAPAAVDGAKDPQSKEDEIRKVRTPDIIRDARMQMKMDWKNNVTSPRRERTVSINSSTIHVEINAQTPLPGQNAEEVTSDPFSRRSSIVSMRNDSGARNNLMETSFGGKERCPTYLTPTEETAPVTYTNSPLW